MRKLIVAALVLPWALNSAWAEETTVTIDRGLTEDRPYTLIYPLVFNLIDDGSATTVATLRHPDVPLQCDAMIADGAPADWSAQAAATAFDPAATAAPWQADFPGFTIVSQGTTQFQSGPALIYDGESPQSPWGIPVDTVHAEAVDGGRTFVLECITAKDAAADTKPLIDFLIANFSTRSDGTCCTSPAAGQ